MDPMDFTMDEAGNHGNQGNNTTDNRYQCQQSSQYSARNGFSSQSRDGPHFDPVHDASNYYYGSSNANAPPRSSYTASQHPQMQMQHWAVSPYVSGTGWQGFGDTRPNPTQGGPESSSYRGPARHHGDVSWGGSRAFGRLEDTYAPFSNQLNGHNLPSDSGMGTGGNSRGGGASQPPALRPSLLSHNFNQPPPVDLLGQSGPSHPRVPPLGTGRTNRHQNPSHPFPEPPNLRYHRPPRPALPRPGMHGSTAAERISWGDSDEESISDLENEAVRREVASYRENEEENSIIMQGALAVGRRMMAKEAFNFLEKMKVEDLPAESKDCTICYNHFGVQNPDGVVEVPVRWPKCKHLFGDKCIKRWFDEGKDTCPYCREKIPFEMAAKRLGLESQMRIMQRRRMMQAAATAQQQPRNGVPPSAGFFSDDSPSGRTLSTPPPFPTPPQFPRTQDEYEAILNRNADSWNYSSPHRYAPGESPERRRQGRGRMTGGRSGHPAGRPVSIGSARSVSQSFAFNQNPPPRAYGPPAPSLHTSTRRTMAPGLQRQPPTQPQTPQARASASLPGSSSASPGEASPPVAVGSGLARNRFSVDTLSSSSRVTAGANGPQRYQRFWDEANALDQRLNAALQRSQSSREVQPSSSSDSTQVTFSP